VRLTRLNSSDGILLAATPVGTLALTSVAASSLPAALLGIATVVVLIIGVAWPKSVLALTATTIPFSPILALTIDGLYVAVCDVLAAVCVAAYVIHHFLRPKDAAPAPLRGVGVASACLAPYFVTMVVQSAHTANGWGPWIAIIQRAEIIFLWLALGAVLYSIRAVRLFLTTYVIVCVAFSLAWITSPGVSGLFGIQKNPSGGFIAAALLIVLISPLRARWRIPALLLLTAGLIGTSSRGAIIGALAVIPVVLLLPHYRKRVFGWVSFAAVVSLIVLLALPGSITQRLFSRDEHGVYTQRIRNVFIQDALEQWQTNRGWGIGIGEYVQQASELQNVTTHDPHNVWILALVEGGFWLLGAFVVSLGLLVLWMLRHRTHSLIGFALIIQASTFVHSSVDVYWVRGTPALGWLLTGAAGAALVGEAYRRQESQTSQQAVRNPGLSATDFATEAAARGS
jgi:hypothetical protein